MKTPLNSQMEILTWAAAQFIKCEFYAPLSEIFFGSVRKITNKKVWQNSPDVQAFLKECEELVEDKQFVMRQSKPEIGGFHISSEIVDIIGDSFLNQEWFRDSIKSKWALGQTIELIYATALKNLSDKGIPPYEAIDETAQKSQIQKLADSLPVTSTQGSKVATVDSDLPINDPEAVQSANEMAELYKSQRPDMPASKKKVQQENVEKELDEAKDAVTEGHIVPRGAVNLTPKVRKPK